VIRVSRPWPALVWALVGGTGCCAGAAWAQADEARAKKIVTGVCFVCHGVEGESASEAFPRLAGQHWEYIAKQLDNFKSGKRKSTAMASMVAKLNSDEMAAIGKYFEKQVVPPEPPKNTVLADAGRQIYQGGIPNSGVPACASCHGPAALGTAALPRLAGQHASYIEAQLKQFHQRERTNDNAIMHTVVGNMTAKEIAAVAEFVSGL
jgi:cytochrome c553